MQLQPLQFLLMITCLIIPGSHSQENGGCPDGEFLGESGFCRPCPNGYVCLSSRNISCASGQYADINGVCENCPAGTYALSGTCDRCSFGESSQSGSTSCTPCPVDTYQFSDNFTTCLACPSGTSTRGLTSRIFCTKSCSLNSIPADCGYLNFSLCTRVVCVNESNQFFCALGIENSQFKCKNAAGVCEEDSFCNGISVNCPEKYISNNTACRPANGSCDVTEFCTGVSAQCPVDTLIPNRTVCRRPENDGNGCDAAEFCNGVSAQCPPDGVKPNGSSCLDPYLSLSCNIPNTCNGIDKSCEEKVKANGTVCRRATGLCGIDLLCDGIDPECPVPSANNDVRPQGTQCRAPSSLCDLPSICDGTTHFCPPNLLKPANTTCRPVSGDCDLEEKCTGSDANCPPDTFKDTTSICRASQGVCDEEETCTGASASCPTDYIKDNTFICRPKAPETLCDMDEYCNGADVTCPNDMYATAGTICRPKQDLCDLEDRCNGTSIACSSNRKDYAYGYKCGNDFYFCASSRNDITFKNGKIVLFGGETLGTTTSSSVLYNLSAVVPYPGCTRSCPSRKCPNGKDMSNFVDAMCRNSTGTLVANQKIILSAPYTALPVCPYWITTLNSQNLPVEPIGSSAVSTIAGFYLFLLVLFCFTPSY